MKFKLLALAACLLVLGLSAGTVPADQPTTRPTTQLSPRAGTPVTLNPKAGSFEYQGQTFRLGMSAEEFISKLGKPDYDDEEPEARVVSYQKSRGILADVYKGKVVYVTFFTYGARGPSFDSMLDVKTSEGINSNSTPRGVDKAYGKPDVVEDLDGVVLISYPTIHFVVTGYKITAFTISIKTN